MKRHRQQGSMLLETTLAVSLLVAAFVGVAQLLAIATQQRKETLWRQHAVRAAGNAMERVFQLPWQQSTDEGLQRITLGEADVAGLPDAELRLVVAEEENTAARRITIRVDWVNLAGRRGQPIELVAWRFPPREDGP